MTLSAAWSIIKYSGILDAVPVGLYCLKLYIGIPGKLNDTWEEKPFSLYDYYYLL